MGKTYIAPVAEKGAGKGLFVEILKKLLPKKRVLMIQSSDFWKQILGTLCKEESRKNMDIVATALRTAFLDDGILNIPLKKAMGSADADVIVLDGLRKPEEVRPIKDMGGCVVFISAKPDIRFQRRKEHAEKTDEHNMTFEQFVLQDDLPSNRTIRSIGETMTDIQIENNGTVEDFEAVIKKFLQEHGVA